MLAAVRENPEKGFRMLMAGYKEEIYWHVRRLLVSHEDAQDAMQETFIRVFRSLTTFKGDSTLRSWIYRIATNEALRLIDQRRGDRLSLDDATAGHHIGSMTAGEYIDYSDTVAVRLQQAILSLPTKQQLAFNLRYYDEMGYEEMATVMGSTASAAKMNYHIAKDKIVKYMNTHD